MQAFTGIFHRPDAVRHPYSRQSASSSSVSLSATYPKQGGQSADAKNVSILISNTLKDAGSDSQRMGTSRVKLASPEEANELGTSLQKVQQQQIQLAADDAHVGHDPMRASTACPHHPTAHPDSTAAPTIFSGDKQDSGAPSAAADAAVHTPPCTPIPIPGPPGLPLIGHSLHYLASSFFPDQLVQWADTYGGVYRISLAGSQYVVVSGTCAQDSAERICM